MSAFDESEYKLYNNYILENYYGKIVEDLYLVCLHPDNKNKNYILIKVPDLQEEIKILFTERKK